ncbi:MAG: hypothetical protein CMO82_14555 [Winogradskyella sp.]|uniref:GLPGLI family protein n=1 Tax=Winogradskyella poriferorum TaxID=307627 RepID=A0ABU7W4P8_9FLAO|nr:hypothetical protein [Winogradskyella sp.]|tara:strand:+ start:934 stop:1716 length:783 start_codon:yes stop_codon:yes gene_type:complete
MKSIFAILFSLLLVQYIFGQKTPVSYVNDSRIGNNQGWVIDNKISEITLKTDSEFEFWSRQVINSCLTWREYNGIWERKNDTIFFYDQYEVKASDSHFSFSTNNQNEFFQLEFKTDKGSDLTNKNINIAFLFDLGEEDWEIEEFEMILEDDFSLKIPFKNIPNINKLATIRFIYYLGNGEKRFGFISADETPTEKEKELPNMIEVTLIEQPEKEIVKRITKGIFIDDEIKIISTQKNKTKLKDETPELIFKEFYKKETEN